MQEANTCGSIWDNDPNGIGVGLYGHEKQDADLFFNKWGVDFIKIDYCGAGQELALDEQKRYTEIYRAFNDITPEWASIKHIINKNLYLSAYARNGHYNDMDMLEIGRGLKPEEEEVHFGMWCIMSSPLLIGCDLTTIPDKSLELLKNKELIAINQDSLGLQAYVVQHEKNGYVLVKDIEQKRGKARAMALYNPSDSICSFSVPTACLELGGTIKVRDLIEHKTIDTNKEYLEYELPPHSAKFFRIEAEKRLESSLYEAEWAYLPCYDDLGTRSKSIRYAPCEKASGKMTVSFIGGSSENYAEWDNVYSKKGGAYEMKIFYLPEKNRKLEVNINGKSYFFKNLETDSSKGIMTITLSVQLNRGENTIRIGSLYCWAPDIDCFTLKDDNSPFLISANERITYLCDHKNFQYDILFFGNGKF